MMNIEFKSEVTPQRVCVWEEGERLSCDQGGCSGVSLTLSEGDIGSSFYSLSDTHILHASAFMIQFRTKSHLNLPVSLS